MAHRSFLTSRCCTVNWLDATSWAAYNDGMNAPRQIALLATIVVSLLAAPEVATAGTVTWVGSTSNAYWSTGSNWDTGLPPDTADDVVITGDSVATSGFVMVKTLTLDAGATLVVPVGGELLLRRNHLTLPDISLLAGSRLKVDGAIGGVAGVNTELRVTATGGGTLGLGASASFLDLTKLRLTDTTLDVSDASGVRALPGMLELDSSSIHARSDAADLARRSSVSVAGSATLTGSNSISISSLAATPTAFPVMGGNVLTASSITGAGTVSTTVTAPALSAPWYFQPTSSATSLGVVLHEAAAPAFGALASTSHQVSVRTTARTISLAATGVTDSGSGVEGYAVTWDAAATTDPGSAIALTAPGDTTISSGLLAYGTWYAHVVVIDAAGNRSAVRHVGPFELGDPVVAGTVDTGTSNPDAGIPGGGDPGVGGPDDDTTAAPTKPVAPSAAAVKLVKTPRLSALAKARSVSVRVPVKEIGVKVTITVTVTKAQAVKLGLKVPKGAKTVVIGTGSTTSTTSTRLTVKVRLTAKAKAALAKAGRTSSKVKSVTTSLRVVLSKSGLSASVTKPVSFRR